MALPIEVTSLLEPAATLTKSHPGASYDLIRLRGRTGGHRGSCTDLARCLFC